jgi:hypothetical protein
MPRETKCSPVARNEAGIPERFLGDLHVCSILRSMADLYITFASYPGAVDETSCVQTIKKAPRSRAPSPFTAHAIGGELALLYEDTQEHNY